MCRGAGMVESRACREAVLRSSWAVGADANEPTQLTTRTRGGDDLAEAREGLVQEGGDNEKVLLMVEVVGEPLPCQLGLRVELCERREHLDLPDPCIEAVLVVVNDLRGAWCAASRVLYQHVHSSSHPTPKPNIPSLCPSCSCTLTATMPLVDTSRHR